MEEELQRPATTEILPPRQQIEAPLEESTPQMAPPPLPTSQHRARKDVEHAPTRERAVARITPSNPLELPVLHEDTIYACITSEALRASGKDAAFRVPDGFVGLLSEPDGRFRSTLLSGEEARGSFLLHLFRAGTQNLKQHLQGMHSKDGFDLSAEIGFSCRFPDGEPSAMQDFLLSHVLGRTHFSGALLKSDLQKEARRAIADIASEMNAADLIPTTQRDAFEAPFLAAMTKRLAASGIEVRGLDSLSFSSRDLEESKRGEARQERRANDAQKREEVRAVIAREKIGAELSRQELSSVLDSLRQKRQLSSIEQEKERLEQQIALESLEREYRAEENNLDSALKKMLAKNELEIDRLKFEEYLNMAAEVRNRLQEDRIEFYIQQIQDEPLKARLLLRLMERDMTPEQLSELAELERARAEAAASSKSQAVPTQEDSEVTANQAAAGPEQEASPPPAFKLAFASEMAPEVAITAQSQRLVSGPQAEVPRYHTEPSEAPMASRMERSEPPPLPTSPQERAASAYREAAAATSLQTFLVTAGRRVMSIEVAANTSQQRLFADLSALPLGSLRSLHVTESAGKKLILAGARRGVYQISLEGKQPQLFPIDTGIAPQTGVNSTLVFQGSIYATHSQFGLLRWSLNAQNYPATRVAQHYTEHAQTVRGLFLDDGVWPTFASGNRIIAIEHDVVPRVVAIYSGAPSEILAVMGFQNRFYAACRSGDVVYWDKTQPERPQVVTRLGSKLFAASMAMDKKSMVLITRDAHVRMLDLRQGMLSRYDAPTEVVMAQDFGTTIAAISRDRASLFLWESFGDGRPYLKINLTEPPYDIAKL